MQFSTVFSKIKKSEVINKVNEEVLFDHQYITLLFLSTIIATLSLILGNSAIIIGAMILSPLIWPIIGVSLATVSSNRKLLFRSLFLLFVSIIITVIVAYVVSFLSPIKDISYEIQIRTNPTFFDLIIALAAGAAAAVTLLWPKFALHIAGVAVAASVMPPLSVSGIGLAYGDFSIFYGSLMLFLTNIASIIFAGIVVFILGGFFKKDSEEQVKAVEAGLIFSFVIIALISIQMLFSLSKILYTNRIEKEIKDVLHAEFVSISEDIVVDSISTSSLSPDKNSIVVEANVRVPSDIKVGVTQKNEIVKKLNAKLNKQADLELKIIPIVRVTSDTKKEDGPERATELVEGVVYKAFNRISKDSIVESIKVSKKDDILKKYEIVATIRVPEGVVVTLSDKEDISFALISKLKAPVDLDLQIFRYSKL